MCTLTYPSPHTRQFISFAWTVPGQAVALIFGRHAAGSCPALLRKPTPDQKSAAFQDLCVSRLGHVASRCTCSCCILGAWAIGDQAPCTCGYTCCPFPGGRGLGICGRPSPVTRVPDSRMNSWRKRNPPGRQHLWAHPDCSSCLSSCERSAGAVASIFR